LRQSVLLGGLFLGVLSALPIISVANCCCLWTIGGGMITAYLAQQEQREPLRLLDGARLGLLAGLTGAVVWLVAAGVLDVLMAPLQQRMMDFVVRSAPDMPPEARGMMESLGRQASLAARLVVGFFFQLFIQTPFAALGGLLGVALFGTAESQLQQP
jgi:hypothetical protein